jgi:hypothetical protein
MKRIADLAGQHLEWVQPSALKMEYELRAGSEVAATLDFRSSFGSLATGRSADGSWTFKRVGFFQTRATVRAEGAETDLAVFWNNTWTKGGTLELPDGRKYPATTNFWATGFDLNDESGSTLIGHRVSGLLRLSAVVEIRSGAGRVPELPWMVMLGCYLIVMMQSDSASVAGVAAIG